MSDYLIGQRVVSNGEICTICYPPDSLKAHAASDPSRVWLITPQGYQQWRASGNVKPLPNGQL